MMSGLPIKAGERVVGTAGGVSKALVAGGDEA